MKKCLIKDYIFKIRKKISSKTLIILGGILFSFFVRYFIYHYIASKDSFLYLVVHEPYGYLVEASNIFRGGEWFMGDYYGHYQLLTFHPKGYTLLLTFLMMIGCDPMHVAHIIMMVCDAFSGYFIYKICDTLFSKSSLSIGALYLWAINPFVVLTCLMDYPDALGCFFVSLILYLYYCKMNNETLKYALLGITIAISASFRSEYVLIIILAIVMDGLRKKERMRYLSKWLIMLTCFITVMTPWMIYSYVKSGHVILTSTTMWGSAYSAIGEKPDNSIHTAMGDDYVDYYAQEHGLDGAYMYEGNQFYKEKFLQYLIGYPKEYLDIIIEYRLAKAFIPGIDTVFCLKKDVSQLLFTPVTNYTASLPLMRKICKGIAYIIARLAIDWGRIISGVLFLSMFAFVGSSIKNKKINEHTFLIMMYLYFPISISLLKQIEYRNVMPSEVVLHIAFCKMVDSTVKLISQHLPKKTIIKRDDKLLD